MPSLNRVFLMGNLTRNPEVRVTPRRQSVADFGVATHRRFRTKSGETGEARCFVEVTAWGAAAEAAGRSLRRGDLVFIEGRLKMEAGGRVGARRPRLGLAAERVQPLGRGPARGPARGIETGRKEER